MPNPVTKVFFQISGEGLCCLFDGPLKVMVCRIAPVVISIGSQLGRGHIKKRVDIKVSQTLFKLRPQPIPRTEKLFHRFKCFPILVP